MYFCYIDESGDCGMYDPLKPDKTGSAFFILVGLIVAANKWKVSLETMKAFRKKIAREAYLPYHVEFHCAEMIDPHKVKEFTTISVSDRWKLMEEYAETIGQNTAFKLITVVLDKTNTNLNPEDYLTESVTKLYQAFDEFLKTKSSNGILFFDRANERQITTHVRKMLGTGASGESIPGVRIGWVNEDPIFRVSSESMFIQSADVAAYTLKEKEFPMTSRKKFNADRIFRKKLMQICFKSKISDENGIIRT
jgi:hypothetical protein